MAAWLVWDLQMARNYKVVVVVAFGFRLLCVFEKIPTGNSSERSLMLRTERLSLLDFA